MEPGYYPFEVINMTPAPAKDGSQNWKYTLRISGGQGSDGADYSGIRIQNIINEKAMWAAVDFFEALFGQKPVVGEDIDPQAPVGRKAEVFINHRDINGKKINNCGGFRALRAQQISMKYYTQDSKPGEDDILDEPVDTEEDDDSEFEEDDEDDDDNESDVTDKVED